VLEFGFGGNCVPVFGLVFCWMEMEMEMEGGGFFTIYLAMREDAR
jgi:hypothetical protein